MFNIPIPLGFARPRFFAGAAILSAITAFCATTAFAVPLQFDQVIGTPTGNTAIGNSDVVQTRTVRFKEVAIDNGQTVDAEIVATVKPGTDFADVGASGSFGDAGYIPNYLPFGDPNAADLGFLYYGNGVNAVENGITLDFRFFNGTGDLAATFSNEIGVSSLKFAIYDVDGESAAKGNNFDQTEFFRAFASDGLQSYQLGDTPQALSVEQDGDVVTFRGPNKNFAEDDASGAVILNYANTSRFTLDFGSVQSSGPSQNGVFSAFDGNLNLVNPDNFGPPIETMPPVPVPASLPLLVSGLAAAVALRRRKMTASS